MPTYEYRCRTCGHQFEAFQRISEAPLTKCPECGKKVERLISAGLGIIFKGSGFYSTDYKKSAATSTSGNGNGSANGDTPKESKKEASPSPASPKKAKKDTVAQKSK